MIAGILPYEFGYVGKLYCIGPIIGTIGGYWPVWKKYRTDGHKSDTNAKIAIIEPIMNPPKAIIEVINARYQPIFFGMKRKINENTPRMIIITK